MITAEPINAPADITAASTCHNPGKVAMGFSLIDSHPNNNPNPAVNPSVVRPDFHSHRAPDRHKTCSHPKPTAVTIVAHHNRHPIYPILFQEFSRQLSDHTNI